MGAWKFLAALGVKSPAVLAFSISASAQAEGCGVSKAAALNGMYAKSETRTNPNDIKRLSLIYTTSMFIR